VALSSDPTFIIRVVENTIGEPPEAAEGIARVPDDLWPGTQSAYGIACRMMGWEDKALRFYERVGADNLFLTKLGHNVRVLEEVAQRERNAAAMAPGPMRDEVLRGACVLLFELFNRANGEVLAPKPDARGWLGFQVAIAIMRSRIMATLEGQWESALVDLRWCITNSVYQPLAYLVAARIQLEHKQFKESSENFTTYLGRCPDEAVEAESARVRLYKEFAELEMDINSTVAAVESKFRRLSPGYHSGEGEGESIIYGSRSRCKHVSGEIVIAQEAS
jgi:hypothetical protein